VVGRELVQEDDRRSTAGLFEIEADIILRDGIGHFGFLFSSRNSKIAVNAHGCNAAGAIFFGHGICAE
jgi:hypothetical protein